MKRLFEKTPKKWIRLAIALTAAQAMVNPIVQGLPVDDQTKKWVDSITSIVFTILTIYAHFQTENVTTVDEIEINKQD